MPQRLESDFELAYASYEELVDRKSNMYEETLRSEQFEDWVKAMKEEINSLNKNQT